MGYVCSMPKNAMLLVFITLVFINEPSFIFTIFLYRSTYLSGSGLLEYFDLTIYFIACQMVQVEAIYLLPPHKLLLISSEAHNTKGVWLACLVVKLQLVAGSLRDVVTVCSDHLWL